MNKDEILDALEDAREQFLEATDDLSDEQMAEPGVEGDWSIKDIIHHLSMWEAELVRLLYQAGQSEKPTTRHFSNLSIDTTNAEWYTLGKERSLDNVLADFEAVRKQTVRRVEALPDASLEDPKRFAWAKGEPLWEWISSDSFGHEREHTQAILAWRQSKGY